MAQQQKPVLTAFSSAQQQDDIQRRQLRWYFFVILTIWTLGAIAVPVVVFCKAKSPYSFSLFSTLAPPIYLWHRFTKYIFSDERAFELEKMRIQDNHIKIVVTSPKSGER